MIYFQYILFIVYSNYISHNITLQTYHIMLKNKQTKQAELDGEESNNSSQLQLNKCVDNRYKYYKFSCVPPKCLFPCYVMTVTIIVSNLSKQVGYITTFLMRCRIPIRH